MRRPDTIERLYLDFDGFFASVEQQARPALRGRPVGIVPFAGTNRTCVIACSREAKRFGVKNIMNVDEARALCPDLVLVPQTPDLYRRAHHALLAEISAVIPVDAVKSIDELTCILDASGRADPWELGSKLKRRLNENIGPYITCSIGFAANRQLAKMAGKMNKPDGLTVWSPDHMPEPLLAIPLEDIPGVGGRMARRLNRASIFTTEQLYNTAPKQMRKLWHSVTGERLWYALHGYDIQALPTERGMFGHGRVLPPEARDLKSAKGIARLLLIKAARRLRRANYHASSLYLWLSIRGGSWSDWLSMPAVQDDHACLNGFETLWGRALVALPQWMQVFRVGVTLGHLTPATERQLDLLLNDDAVRQKWEAVTRATDHLNAKHSRTLVSLGPWNPPAGGHVGGKISYTRIPSAEDFW